jgi:CHAD domain-containing protein/CYTH domain-containing protein
MAAKTRPLTELTPAEGARRLVLEMLDRAKKFARKLDKKNADDEALHHLRTSLRRLRSVLEAYRDVLGPTARRHEKILKRIAGTTGSARDAEVALEWLQKEFARPEEDAREGVKWLAGKLKAEKDRGYARGRKEMAGAFAEEEKALRKDFGRARGKPDSSRPNFGAQAAVALKALTSDLRDHLEVVEDIEDVDEMHKARIRTKRVRYALEPLDGIVPTAGKLVERSTKLQDVLGDLHDRQELLRRISGHLDDGVKPTVGKGLERIAAHAHKDEKALFRKLHKDWLDGDGKRLISDVEALADALTGSGGGPGVEIERKYLLSALPARARKAPVKEIWQGWIPGKKLQERLRRVKDGKGEHLFRTVKLGRGVQRIEVEEQAPKPLFDKMWPLTKGHRVHKRRYLVKDGEFTWELDAFSDIDLFLAEVELPSADTKVEVPDWLAPCLDREVTGEDKYVNVNLAR